MGTVCEKDEGAFGSEGSDGAVGRSRVSNGPVGTSTEAGGGLAYVLGTCGK